MVQLCACFHLQPPAAVLGDSAAEGHPKAHPPIPTASPVPSQQLFPGVTGQPKLMDLGSQAKFCSHGNTPQATLSSLEPVLKGVLTSGSKGLKCRYSSAVRAEVAHSDLGDRQLFVGQSQR